MMEKKEGEMNKKGQVTIFIIIGIVIVVAAVLVFLFWPGINFTFGEEQTPDKIISDCIEEDLDSAVELVSMQGGSLNPVSYYLYQDSRIEYLCYAESFLEFCVVQQPLLKSHVETQIKSNIDSRVNVCFDQLRETYQNRGYEVGLSKNNYTVELLPKRILITFNYPLTLSRDSVQNYDKITVLKNNNLYELTGIANSIINSELTFGDSETTDYMTYYPWLKVEKHKQTDGTTVYILTDRNSGDKFQFASRSMAWPPGYGTGSITA